MARGAHERAPYGRSGVPFVDERWLDQRRAFEPIWYHSHGHQFMGRSSTMRYPSIFALLLLVPMSAGAQDVPMGCYLRDYSPDHLAKHPEQVVDRISILFRPGNQFTAAEVNVLFADQGHAARDGYGGLRGAETAGNFNADVPLKFAVECDGGSFDVIESSADHILIETSWFRLSDNGCGSDEIRSTLLEEGSASTRYRLDQVEETMCAW